jgi:ankyrin repeat protein
MLIEAAKIGDVKDIRRIIAEDPGAVTEVGPDGETPVMAALYRGHTDAVAALVEAGAPVNLFAAAATGRLETLDREIARGNPSVTDCAYDGWTALHLAAFFGRQAAAERLLAAGADPTAVSRNSMRNTPLHAALAGGHTDVALYLITRGADVNAVDAGRHTPLHIAAENGLIDAVRALVAAGADAHAVDAEDNTPLSRAAARNRHEVVDILNS